VFTTPSEYRENVAVDAESDEAEWTSIFDGKNTR